MWKWPSKRENNPALPTPSAAPPVRSTPSKESVQPVPSLSPVFVGDILTKVRMANPKEKHAKLCAEEWCGLSEFLKEYAPLSPEHTREFFDKQGGLKKMTLDLYERLMREGHLKLAAELMADVKTRSDNPDREITREHADILGSMKHDA